MNKLTVLAFGGALTVATIAGGIGVALAHGPGDHHGDGMMNGQAGMHMSMDAGSMEQHMREVMGDEAYAAMRGVLGEDAYQEMFSRMEAGCPGMAGMMDGESGSPNHEAHHGASGG